MDFLRVFVFSWLPLHSVHPAAVCESAEHREDRGAIDGVLYGCDVIETVGNSFEAALEAIKPAAVAVASKFRNFTGAPEGVEVEFGLKFAGQAGAFIASASTEAQFRVKVIWKGKPTR